MENNDLQGLDEQFYSVFLRTTDEETRQLLTDLRERIGNLSQELNGYYPWGSSFHYNDWGYIDNATEVSDDQCFGCGHYRRNCTCGEDDNPGVPLGDDFMSTVTRRDMYGLNSRSWED